MTISPYRRTPSLVNNISPKNELQGGESSSNHPEVIHSTFESNGSALPLDKQRATYEFDELDDTSVNLTATFLSALKTNQVQTLVKIGNHLKFDYNNLKPGELEESVHQALKNRYFEVFRELLKLPWFDLKKFLHFDFPFKHNFKLPIYLACRKSREEIFDAIISHFDQLLLKNSLSTEEMRKFLRDALFAATNCRHSSMANLRKLLNHQLTDFKELMRKVNNQSKNICNPMDLASLHDNKEATALFLDFLGDAVVETAIRKNIFRSFALAMDRCHYDVFYTILNWPLKIIQGDISQFISNRDSINILLLEELIQREGISLDFKFFQQIIGHWNLDMLKVLKLALNEKIDDSVLDKLAEPIIKEIHSGRKGIMNVILVLLESQQIDPCRVLKDPIILNFLYEALVALSDLETLAAEARDLEVLAAEARDRKTFAAKAAKAWDLETPASEVGNLEVLPVTYSYELHILPSVREILKHPLIDVSTRGLLTIARQHGNESMVQELIRHPTARGF